MFSFQDRMHKTTYKLEPRHQPTKTDLSYQKHQASYELIKEKPKNYQMAASLSHKYKNLVSQSSYGKSMVASYNSYFRQDRGNYERPTLADIHS